MSTLLPGTAMRRRNERLVLAMLREQSEVTRADISARLGLTASAVSRITGSLLERGLIQESRVSNVKTSGRRPTLLRLSRTLAGIGIDARIDRTEAVCLESGGEILLRLPVEMPTKPTVDEFIEAVTGAVEEIRRRLPHALAGVGVAFPGVLSRGRRGVKTSYYLGWEDVDLLTPLEDALELPIGLRHVAECAAMANAREPELKHLERLLHIQIGAGLGMALTRGHDLDETLPIGWGGAGHVFLGPPDLQCVCGRRGCIDTVVGFDAFAQAGVDHGMRVERSADGMNEFARDVARRAESGEDWAQARIAQLQADLSRVIAVFSTIEMPDAVTLGGYPLALGERFMQDLSDELGEHLLSPSPLLTTAISDDASVRGAAMLGLAQLSRP